jgi:hypothetical protein
VEYYEKCSSVPRFPRFPPRFPMNSVMPSALCLAMIAGEVRKLNPIRGRIMMQPGTIVTSSSRPSRTRSNALVRLVPALVVGTMIGQQSALTQSPLEVCVVELSLPAYEVLHWQAQITGKASVDFRIAHDGSLDRVTVEGVHRALAVYIESKMRASKFLPRCAGRMLHFEFVFELKGEPKDGPNTAIKFRPPNVFMVSSNPPKRVLVRD